MQRPPSSGAAPGGQESPALASLLDDRYRMEAPIAEGILLRELRGIDTQTGAAVALWMPHREVTPAFEDIEAEMATSALPEDVTGSLPAGCRRVLDRGRRAAYVVGELADHVGPRPGRLPHPREVVAGWFRAVAGIITRNHALGRWHGLLTCDDLAISRGQLVASGFGFWVRADAEAIAGVLADAEAARIRELCAPEVLSCAIGPAADLWALGRCTLALATGSGEGEAMAALQQRHPPLARLLGGLLHPDPEARPSDLRVLAEEVTRALRSPYLDGGQPRPARQAPQASVAAKIAAAEQRAQSQAEGALDGGLGDHEDTDRATYEPHTGTWSGAALEALALPTPHAQSWSPPSQRPRPPPLQVISMKDPTAPRTTPREGLRLPAPRLRPIQEVLAAANPPTPQALGTIAPPRALTQPVQAPRRPWLVTVALVVLALLALVVAVQLLGLHR